ncbi:MAG TPA: hypothetical protein VGN86_12485 [Pyrinomonadaceae bacterium]|nr:hypothetical protein [Pyrinomonadaceae bacterium]
MKKLRQICAVTILTTVLAMSAFAGQIQCPGAPSPSDPPPPGDMGNGGNQGNGGRTDDGNQGSGNFASLWDEILDLVF